MTGIFLLFVIAIWAVVAYALTKLIALKWPRRRWRAPALVVVFVVLFALPVLDEIVGMFQFQRLCRQNANIHIQRDKTVGRKVYLANIPDEEVKGAWVQIVVQPTRFLDVASDEPIISYNRLDARGGWLIHALGISERNAPLLFRGSCVPGDQFTLDRLFRELNITLSRR